MTDGILGQYAEYGFISTYQLMGENEDPLKSLLIEDSKELDRKNLADLLRPYIRIDAEKQLTLLPGFHGIKSNPDKLEIILIATKARSLLFPDTEDGLTPSEIIAMDIMPGGSVKTAIKALREGSHIKKKSKKYIVLNYRLEAIILKHIPKH